MSPFAKILLKYSALFMVLININHASDFNEYNPQNLSTTPQLTIEERYQEALRYRNGEINGFPKDALHTLELVAQKFLELAHEGHIKSMHNVASVYYKQKKWGDAYVWFNEAAEQEFEPSINNLKNLLKDYVHPIYEIKPIQSSQQFLSKDIINYLLKFLSKKDMGQFRLTSKLVYSEIDSCLYDSTGHKCLSGRNCLINNINDVTYRLNESIKNGTSHLKNNIPDDNFLAEQEKIVIYWLNYINFYARKYSIELLDAFFYQLSAYHSNPSYFPRGHREELDPLYKILDFVKPNKDKIKLLAHYFFNIGQANANNIEEKMYYIKSMNTLHNDSNRWLDEDSKIPNQAINIVYNVKRSERVLKNLLQNIDFESEDYADLLRFVIHKQHAFYSKLDRYEKIEEIIRTNLLEEHELYFKIKSATKLQDSIYIEYCNLPKTAEYQSQLDYLQRKIYKYNDLALWHPENPNNEKKFNHYVALRTALISSVDKKIYQKCVDTCLPLLQQSFNIICNSLDPHYILSYYLNILNDFGAIQFKSSKNDIIGFFKLANKMYCLSDQERQIDLKQFIPQLEERLKELNFPLPLILNGNQIIIQNISSLTFDEKMNIIQLSQAHDHYISAGEISYGFDNRYILGKFLEFDQQYFSSKSFLLVAKEIKITKLIDAREGTIMIAEKFNIDQARFTMPHLCKFILVDSINIEYPIDIRKILNLN